MGPGSVTCGMHTLSIHDYLLQRFPPLAWLEGMNFAYFPLISKQNMSPDHTSIIQMYSVKLWSPSGDDVLGTSQKFSRSVLNGPFQSIPY